MKMRKTNNGSALLTVLGIVAVVSIIIGMLHFTARQQTQSTIITRDMLKARMIAESALNSAYNDVRNDFDKIKGYRSTGTTPNGTYEVTSKSFDGEEANRAQLSAKGVCGSGHVIVSVDLENINMREDSETLDDDFQDISHDLIVGSAMELTGNFHAHISSIHANGEADLSGSAAVDASTISSSKSIEWKKAPENVELKPNQPEVSVFPDDVKASVDALKAYAEKNGAVYETGADVPANPPGGIAWCKGSSDGWSGVGNGCYIFDGVFTGKHLDVSAPNGYPSLIVLSPSDIQLNAGTVLKGAVLLPSSSLKFNGHAEIHGPLVVGQGISGLGTADLYAGAGQGFNLPPDEDTKNKVIITAWH